MSATRPKRPSRAQGLLLATAAVACLAVGTALYTVFAPRLRIVAVELGGGAQPRLSSKVPAAIGWDIAFVAGYGLSLGIGTYVAMWFARTARQRFAVSAARWAAGLTVGADLIEDVLLLAGGGDPSRGRDLVLDGAATASTIKFCTLLPAATVAMIGIGLALVRCVANTKRALRLWSAGDIDFLPPLPLLSGDADPPGPGSRTDAYRWRRAFLVAGGAEAGARWDDRRPPVAVCLSGGGVRAASTALGALQTMRARLTGADYLISVSGGGYTNGAFAQALTGEPPPHRFDGEVLRDVGMVLTAGSVGEDHIRRHAAYLAETVPELLMALALIVRHLLLSLVALFGPAIVAGVAFGAFYRAVPLTDVGEVTGTGLHRRFLPTWDDLRPAPWIALAILGLAALGTWLLSSWLRTRFGGAAPVSKKVGSAADIATGLAATAAAVIIAVPTLAWSAAWLFAHFGGMRQIAIGGPIGSILLTYGSTLFTLGYRKRVTIKNAFAAASGKGDAPGGAVVAAAPAGAVQLALVAITLGVLAVSWLLLFGAMVLTGGTAAAVWTALGVGVVVVVLGGFVDETTLSLHPFYRKRLAGAFAVRAVTPAGSSAVVALPYAPEERTTLSSYGRARDPFPSQVFAATAHLSGEYRTASGHTAVSFVFNSDVVGGPDVGWMKTTDLERLTPPRLRRDLTVQAAVAISGAAFASTKGRGARYNQLIMTIAGLRLGAWLPNPAALHAAYLGARDQDWRTARPPRVRRIGCLLNEILNIHRFESPLLQVTDGGHYENLGLVEAVRRRCGLVLCVDASGDTPPTATTLSQAIDLARSELGVEIEIDGDPFDIEPGGGAPLKPEGALGTLNARLSAGPLVTGKIRYPAEAGIGEQRVGTLILAKTTLWAGLPYDLLSYAAKHEIFPRDGTGDQFFNADQFSAYLLLGRHLGEAILAEAHGPSNESSSTRPRSQGPGK